MVDTTSTVCERCGLKIPAQSRFCMQCGCRLPAQQLVAGVVSAADAGADDPAEPSGASPPTSINGLVPPLLAVAVIGIVLGQFSLGDRAKEGFAFASYALGTLSFLSAVALQRYRPSGAAWALAAVPALPALSRPAALAPIGALLLGVALLSIDSPGMSGFAAMMWALGLLLVLAGSAAGRRHSWQNVRTALRWPRLSIARAEALAIGTIVVAGAALRFYALPDYPSGIHGDETGFGLIAADILKGNGPHPFGTAFLDDPALFMYYLAPFVALFGQTITALRLSAAIPGALTLIALYVFMRRTFGWRPAVLALLLLAGSSLHVNFSRLALNVAEVPLLATMAFYALCEGTRSRRVFWWLASGMLGALAAYFHFAGRFLAVAIGLCFLHLLVTRRQEWRDWLKGAFLALLGGLLVLAPLGVHLANKSYALVNHMNERLIFNNWPRVVDVHRTADTWAILWGQLKVNFLAFITPMGGGTFYPGGGVAMLALALGPAAVLGLVYILLSLKDIRFALLAFWFAAALAINGVLTIDSPQPHRLLPALIPLVAAIALVFDWVIGIGGLLGGPRLAGALLGATLALGLVAGYQDEANYFGPIAAVKPWETTTSQGKFLAGLGAGYRAYTLGTPYVYFEHSVTRFLAADVPGASMHNPAAELPLAVPPDRDVAFIANPALASYIPVLQGYYPSGRLDVAQGRAGPVFTAYIVPKDDLARCQGLTARYPGGERAEVDPRSLGGGAESYPAKVTWSGSIFAERAGRYGLQLDGLAGELTVDGVALQGPGELDLSRGWHALTLTAQIPDAAARGALQWRPPGQALAVVPRQNLDRSSLPRNLRAVLTGGASPAQRRDQTIGFRNLATLLSDQQGPLTIDWQGSLDVPSNGRYVLSVNSAERAELELDGRQIVSNPGRLDSPVAAAVDLVAGPHRLKLRYEWRRGSSGCPQPCVGTVELLWSPPGGQLAIIPPAAFAPAE